ncbi:hypothetical protein AA313_de0206042 [Arthrobotrys entomopaga]|nr:hypothetical protein AA313_de0206042 [Arthrobotrys entomopaga]
MREAVAGGLYDPSLSSKFINTTDFGNVRNLVFNTTETGTDFVFINDETFLQDIPFSFSSSPGATQNQGFVGLGSDSSLLNTLVEKKYITSRSWGFWNGLVNNSLEATVNNTVPGSLVLGGYDATRVAGSFTDFEISASSPSSLLNCPFPVQIKEIKWLGMDVLARTGQKGFTACVTTGSRRFELPPGIWDGFTNLLNNTLGWPMELNPVPLTSSQNDNLDFPNLDINTILGVTDAGFTIDSVFLNSLSRNQGSSVLDFTATIEGGIESSHFINITIPGSQIFEPQHTLTKNGTFVNGEIKYAYDTQPAISRGAIGANPVWGLPFLSGAYLLVNWENSTFNLAQATLKTNQIPKKTLLVGVKPPVCYPNLISGGKKGINPQSWVIYTLPTFVGSMCVAVFVYCLYTKYRNGELNVNLFEVPKFLMKKEKFYGIEKDGMEIVESGGVGIQSPVRVVHHRDPHMVFELPESGSESITESESEATLESGSETVAEEHYA